MDPLPLQVFPLSVQTGDAQKDLYLKKKKANEKTTAATKILGVGELTRHGFLKIIKLFFTQFFFFLFGTILNHHAQISFPWHGLS